MSTFFLLVRFGRKESPSAKGRAPVKRYNEYLRDLIIAGRAKPSFIIGHRLPLSKTPEAYAKFDQRGTGEGANYTKVLLKPDLDRKAA